MKAKYYLYQRNDVYYVQDKETGKQQSLKTSDRDEAERILNAKNDAASHQNLNLAIGQAYLNAVDPELTKRQWQDVMNLIAEKGKGATQERAVRAFRSKEFDFIRHQAVFQSTASDFLKVLESRKASVAHYLKLLQSTAINHGWRLNMVLPKASWPMVSKHTRRAITSEEHEKIIEAETKGGNKERRLYYQLLWETGSSQSDAANLSNDSIQNGILIYNRQKTGTQAAMRISKKLKLILKQLPHDGLLFPKIASLNEVARAAEFNRRCRLLNIKGVSLHSYRYAWAERAYTAGLEERFAMAALGHSSSAIHHSYSRNAKVVCPAIV